MAQDLSSWVLGHLLDHRADEDCADLAIAAMGGDAELEEALTGTGTRPKAQNSPPAEAPHGGAFLKSLTVQGFRGVGPKIRVDFHPAPGLTIVAGRNGSGKSSLAEALEVALTSETHRWHNAQFSQVWRNLHQDDPAEIDVELAREGVGKSTIKVAWPQGETHTERAHVTYQRAGHKQQEGLGSLGWEAALEMYRPILSYEELGQMLSGRPIDLHKALAKVLGLDDIKSGIDRLTERRNALRSPISEADKARKELRELLDAVDDERASAASDLLRKTKPDLASLRGLAVGESGTTAVGQILADIAAVTVPSVDDVTAAATGLREAAERLRDLGDQGQQLTDLRHALLEEALRYHAVAGPGPCPVCEQGELDETWRARTEEAVSQSNLLTSERRQADASLTQARARVRSMITSPPMTMTQTDLLLASQARAAEAWHRWEDAPPGDVDLASHVAARHSDLARAVAGWQAEAAAVAVLRSDAWTPVANRLSAWLVQYEEARLNEALVARLTKAIQALQAADKDARTERFVPIVDHAKRIWAQLRHESNVDLHDIVLTGQSNTRKVEISASVDGAESGALAVMSQGELHALALALFLPRAAMDASPFRFIILDDPVQAMDPAKVEGLVAVLSELAKTRQVIVLSHDDRLPQAARRLVDPPRILEVTRASGSRLQITQSLDPTQRFLDEAYALFKDDGLPEATKRLVLPGIFRFALETAARDRYLGRQIAAGVSHVAAEAAWHNAKTTSARVALALDRADLGAWRTKTAVRSRALAVSSGGMHGPLVGDIKERLKDVQATVREISAGAP